MRSILVAAFVATAGLCLTQPSGAATRTEAGARPHASITLIDGGCGGPEFYRAANGYCYRKPGYYGPGYAPGYAPGYRPGYVRPPYYYNRACGPGFHLTPYGCRPNY